MGAGFCFFVLLLVWGCKGREHGSDVQFKIDTAQIHQMDSMAALQRKMDSDLLHKADSAPGINAGSGKFDIRTPSGWQRTDTVMGNIKAVLLSTPSASSRFRTNISVVSDSMNRLSFDAYEQATIANMAKYVEQFVFINKGERVIDTVHARWIHYSQSPGIPLENICYIVPDKGVVYIITCSALKGHLVESRPQFEQAVSSFHLRH